jgi:glycogen debranching enzyme
MDETIQVNDQFYILATSPRAEENARVLKHGDTFAVFDHFGDLRPVGMGEEGIYHEGTRHLNRLGLWVDRHRPLLLSSTVREDNALLTVDLTNPDVQVNGEVVLPRDTIHIHRSSFLWNGVCYSRLHIRNYALRPIELLLTLMYDADFADIFEVRGMKRERRGTILPPRLGADYAELSYCGLDEVVRRTRLDFSPTPLDVSATMARFQMKIASQAEEPICVVISCGAENSTCARFEPAFNQAAGELQRMRELDAHVHTSNELFNDWLNRSAADLHMMVSQTPYGMYPYAGVPWFSTPFGRDGIITALEYLWVNPELARGVLCYLAATQAQSLVPEQDAEPGKILHETRRGEMAALGEIPFGRYYGTADATPLFIVLAGAYFQRTGDLQLIEQLWPNILRALDWIDGYGDMDGDGFFEYARRSAKGLVTQGWKDSFDSVFHADGTLAEPPIALCEVQGYIFAARRAASELAVLLGHAVKAEQLADAAEHLRQKFEDAFWCEELSTYVLALDGAKRPCRVRTSNAGHCLLSAIASPARAVRTTSTLLEETSFSGWGIRTVATSEARFNPMAYHNGSIWPHDNALIAYGMSLYDLKRSAMKVLTGLFDASLYMDLRRMPELFCGFPRRSGEGPTLYPVACAPQSWAAGSVFLLLQACLGMAIDAPHNQIRFTRPVLPEWLETMTIRNLRVGQAHVDLWLERHAHDVGIHLVRREGELEIIVVK